MEKHVTDIVEWLRLQVKTTGVKGLLVGVSGGLDSAVVAQLIKQAFPHQSLGVIMPLKSSNEEMADASDVVNNCGISSRTIDLTDAHDTLLSAIRIPGNRQESGDNPLTDANLRARLRMSTLYAIAGELRYLVVGTDNASEWYTGYFTKYGDGGVDIHPLVEYTKQEVRDMASHLGVAQKVIDKKPSAGLWEGQSDEDEMGISYDTIDAYLKQETIPDNDKERIENMHQKTEHKRKTPVQYQRKRL